MLASTLFFSWRKWNIQARSLFWHDSVQSVSVSSSLLMLEVQVWAPSMSEGRSVITACHNTSVCQLPPTLTNLPGACSWKPQQCWLASYLSQTCLELCYCFRDQNCPGVSLVYRHLIVTLSVSSLDRKLSPETYYSYVLEYDGERSWAHTIPYTGPNRAAIYAWSLLLPWNFRKPTTGRKVFLASSWGNLIQPGTG